MDWKNLKYVLVEWVDSVSHDPWEHYSDAEFAPHTIVSVGILLRDDTNIVALALNADPSSEMISCTITIPKSCIVRMEDLCQKNQKK